MANIDVRLTPLVETLIASGADSIAIEVLIAIQRGLVEEDSADELREAREAIGHSREGNQQREYPPTREAKVHHLTGDEQIEFAADYVIERLARELDMTDASLENLNQIVNGPGNEPLRGESNPSSVRLRRSDNERDLGREQLATGRAQLAALREALSTWSLSVRAGGQSK